MRAVVSDTGPLNYLIWIDRASLLPALFGTIQIPAAVRTELERSETPAAVRSWISHSPPWLVTNTIEPADDLSSLGLGEREAIALARLLDAGLVLMDDRLAVSSARARGFNVTGTLGVLDLAAQRGLVDIADAIERLRATSFRVRPALLEELSSRYETRARDVPGKPT